MDAYIPQVGTHISNLETPCLIVELDALENNFQVVAETYKNTHCKMREHTKNIKSPFLAKMQMSFGGTNGGVCTAKVAEAEIMIQGGVTDILIPNQVVTLDKIERVCTLAKQGDLKLCVDSIQNVETISQIASKKGVQIGILIEVDTAMGRAGVRSPEHGVSIAKAIHRLDGVSFRGVMSHQNVEEDKTPEGRNLRAKETIDICLAVKDAIEEAGYPVEIVSTGETFCYEIAASIPGVTEVEGGSYALMSTSYSYLTEFQIAGKVLGTVVSRPNTQTAIGDIGSLSLAAPAGIIPTFDGDDVQIDSIHSDHIVLKPDNNNLNVGDHFKLLPGHQDMLVNRWDKYVAIRNDIVEEVWDIPGRGCYH